ncbi:MAG: polysaccharide pyruvyl transferase family protein [Oscillospiraceae bacterium]|nr:polysaccharide pyruvyl transferase family protein [Oscillospiraceae bacterium]
MKIGVLAFHNSNNFGAVFQVYALQSFLENKGFEVEVIDFRPRYITCSSKLIPHGYRGEKKYRAKRHVKRAFTNILYFPRYKKRKNLFENFRKERLNRTSGIYTCDEELRKLDFDVYIFGSDQVWNPNITNGLEGAFFGEFSQGKSKKIAYAASMGIRELPEEHKERFKKLVTDIDFISVREHQIVELIKEYSGKPVEHVLDPTLLVDVSELNKVAEEINIEGNYLLVHPLLMSKEDDRIYKASYEVAEKLNLEVIELGNKGTNNPKYQKHKILVDIPPEKIARLFEKAKFVITNSFHGTAFSIANKKQFYIFGNPPVSDRMISILDTLDLSNRYVEDELNIDEIKEIDYEKVEEKLKFEREKSAKFLLNALSESEE